MKTPFILLINPWIYDFAAFDFWLRPLGILRIAAILKECGCDLKFIDCLDRFNKDLIAQKGRLLPRMREYGCGKFYKEKAEKPDVFKGFEREYFRYGIPVEIFNKCIKTLETTPDLILVTSGMTFWYLGIQHVIGLLKNHLKNIPVVLGGIYANLCPQHALDKSGADYVFSGTDYMGLLKFLSSFIKLDIKKEYNFQNLPYTLFELLTNRELLVIQTSKGCPFGCTYCASNILDNRFLQKSPEAVINEIEYYIKNFNCRDIAFYDDALLANSDSHIKMILKGLIRKNLTDCNYHTPNGMNVSNIDMELATLMFKTNFKTIRLSLDSSKEDIQKSTSLKVTNAQLERAIFYLKEAGFKSSDITVYTMAGLPRQNIDDIIEDIIFVANLKVRSMLVSYSPIPGTQQFKKLYDEGFDYLEREPLLHNSSVFQAIFYGTDLDVFKRIRRFSSLCNKLVLSNQGINKRALRERAYNEIFLTN
ncbi:MAG: radical SAM protein [Candidatus Omnitrophica bacterium]|nr:radical SAM protein [Candidatus Omnitrophota bacterium]